MRYAFLVVIVALVLVLLWWVSLNPHPEARRWRLVWAVFAIMFIFGALSFSWIQKVASDNREQSAENCHTAEDFRALLANRVTYEIRQLAAQRDAVADEIANMNSDVVNTPGYSELPEPIQRFLGGLIVREIAQANRQLARLDSQLRTARAEVDQIRVFVLAVDCPGETDVGMVPIPTVTDPLTTEG